MSVIAAPELDCFLLANTSPDSIIYDPVLADTHVQFAILKSLRL